MVEVYINHRRVHDLESQLNMNWDLKFPNNPNLCEDMLNELELSIVKLEESNDFITSLSEYPGDQRLVDAVEENKLVIRRKNYQIDQLKNHMKSLTCSNDYDK